MDERCNKSTVPRLSGESLAVNEAKGTWLMTCLVIRVKDREKLIPENLNVDLNSPQHKKAQPLGCACQHNSHYPCQ